MNKKPKDCTKTWVFVLFKLSILSIALCLLVPGYSIEAIGKYLIKTPRNLSPIDFVVSRLVKGKFSVHNELVHFLTHPCLK